MEKGARGQGGAMPHRDDRPWLPRAQRHSGEERPGLENLVRRGAMMGRAGVGMRKTTNRLMGTAVDTCKNVGGRVGFRGLPSLGA
jgi:hypothetical protein